MVSLCLLSSTAQKQLLPPAAHVSDPRCLVLHWKCGSGCRKNGGNLTKEWWERIKFALVRFSGPEYSMGINGKLGHLSNIKNKPKHVEEENTWEFSNASYFTQQHRGYFPELAHLSSDLK